MIRQQEVLKILIKIGAVVTDSHVVYPSGKHGRFSFDKDKLYPHTKEIGIIAKAIAERFRNFGVEVVVGPAIGGIILSQWVAYHLSKMLNQEVLSIYAEKTENNESFIIRRGYDKFISGKKILIVEDALTTGVSVKKVVEVVRGLGGKVIGVGVICNRNGLSKNILNVPKLFALIEWNQEAESYNENKCPLCAQEIPINTDFGKGREFIAK
jgi:orotate phosphoribosyltransferase